MTRQAPWVCSTFYPQPRRSNVAIRRQAFETIGGFSEDLMLIGEDFDLCWRSQLSGHRFALNTDAVVAKRERQGFKAVFSRYVITGDRALSSFGDFGPTASRAIWPEQ